MAAVPHVRTETAPEGNCVFTVMYDDVTEAVISLRCANANTVRYARIDFYQPGGSVPVFTFWANPGEDTAYTMKGNQKFTMNSFDYSMRFATARPA